MLTPSEASDIAKRAGLSLADAVGLRQLADTKEEAVELANRFAAAGGDDAGFAARLLGADRGDIAAPEIRPDPTDDEVVERRAVRQILGGPPRTPGDDAA